MPRANQAVTVPHPNVMRVLALSGSLRSGSINTALLRAVSLLAWPTLDIVLFEDLDKIPAFNPDLDSDRPPASVLQLRNLLRASGAVLFSTPEYAHGIPGALKNALDWVVGSGEFSGKPVAIINASARGEYAVASLREIVKTMDGRLLSEIEITVPLLNRTLNALEIAADADSASVLRGFLHRLSSAIEVCEEQRSK